MNREAQQQSAAARHVSPYTFSEKLARLAWAVVEATLFRGSFHTWHGWRITLLNMFGATIDRRCTVSRRVRFECPWNLTMGRNCSLGDGANMYCLGPVTLGERITISQHAHVCAGDHDYTTPLMALKRPPITIHDDAWIAADAFVGPNVTVGEGAILGARGCAFSDLEPWMIYGGNPAKPIKSRERFTQ